MKIWNLQDVLSDNTAENSSNMEQSAHQTSGQRQWVPGEIQLVAAQKHQGSFYRIMILSRTYLFYLETVVDTIVLTGVVLGYSFSG